MLNIMDGDVSDNDDEAIDQPGANRAMELAEPPKKKSKGLRKLLGSTSDTNVLTSQERIKQELNQYLHHLKIDMEESSHLY